MFHVFFLSLRVPIDLSDFVVKLRIYFEVFNIVKMVTNLMSLKELQILCRNNINDITIFIVYFYTLSN